ncbi:MAG: hypothetical protein IPN17_13570 [Deltaproteobacteria bacterium]|nr:hypothetical protein [Deltaproteobacteria bacterium]
MKKIALSSLLCVSATLFSSAALAQQCPPGAVCAGAQLNTGIFGIGGSLQIGGGVAAPRPVYVQPAQPVYVQPPQPVYVQAPQPVYVQPQTVYVQQPTRYVVSQPVQYTTTSYQWIGLQRNQAVGFGAFASGLSYGGRGDNRVSLGGVGATMRFRYHPYLATELTLGGYFGRDYNGDQRAEVPATVNELIYFNPMHRLQVYGILGIGMSWASVQYEGANAVTRGRDTAGYAYFGGQAGLGLEWQLTRNFSLFTDARAFIRTRVDTEVETNPEYTRSNGVRTETTNTSAGITGQLGAMFYF